MIKLSPEACRERMKSTVKKVYKFLHQGNAQPCCVIKYLKDFS